MGGYGRDGMGMYGFRSYFTSMFREIKFLMMYCSYFSDQGGYGSVGRMGMGSNYSGGYGTPDGLGGYSK